MEERLVLPCSWCFYKAVMSRENYVYRALLNDTFLTPGGGTVNAEDWS